MQNVINNPPEFISDPRYEKAASKTAGRKSAGEKGGVYKYHYDAETIHTLMIKCETDKKGKAQPHKVIAEYMGAEIVGALVPNAVPQTYLMSALGNTDQIIPDSIGNQVYLASVYF